MKNIEQLTVRLEPFRPDLGLMVVMVEVRCNGKIYNWHHALDEDDLISRFHRLMMEAEQLVLKTIEKEEQDAKPE
jgi:hypothetical protein